jgi:hypothetical protein
LRLARALDRPLALGRRWSAWLAALQVARESAAASGDAAGEAWALHQLGTRAYALGRPAAAVELLEDALHRRESLGDRPGAANTRHNLEFIGGDGPAHEDDEPDDEGPPGDDRHRRVAGRGVLAILAAIAVLLLGTVVALGGTGHGTESAPPISSGSDAPGSSTQPAGHEHRPALGDRHTTTPDDAGTTTDPPPSDPPPSDPPPPADTPPAADPPAPTRPDDTRDYGACPGCDRPAPGPR